jgi:hypothetical protein
VTREVTTEPSPSRPDSNPPAPDSSRAGGGRDSNGGGHAPAEEKGLDAQEVRQRAVAGAAVVVLRGFGVRILGMVGTFVLARLLTPHDFGVERRS